MLFYFINACIQNYYYHYFFLMEIVQTTNNEKLVVLLSRHATVKFSDHDFTLSCFLDRSKLRMFKQFFSLFNGLMRNRET